MPGPKASSKKTRSSRPCTSGSVSTSRSWPSCRRACNSCAAAFDFTSDPAQTYTTARTARCTAIRSVSPSTTMMVFVAGREGSALSGGAVKCCLNFDQLGPPGRATCPLYTGAYCFNVRGCTASALVEEPWASLRCVVTGCTCSVTAVVLLAELRGAAALVVTPCAWGCRAGLRCLVSGLPAAPAGLTDRECTSCCSSLPCPGVFLSLASPVSPELHACCHGRERCRWRVLALTLAGGAGSGLTSLIAACSLPPYEILLRRECDVRQGVLLGSLA
mmetsp:Transcript_13734/g.29528  ORF Transcript_13734/g.29528 Transcript_13734/m.29528 type:complete len:275 (+) Transcript_13734:460-1284(+)